MTAVTDRELVEVPHVDVTSVASVTSRSWMPFQCPCCAASSPPSPQRPKRRKTDRDAMKSDLPQPGNLTPQKKTKTMYFFRLLSEHILPSFDTENCGSLPDFLSELVYVFFVIRVNCVGKLDSPMNGSMSPSGGQAREGNWTYSGGGAISQCRICRYDWQRNHDRNAIKGKQLLLKRAVCPHFFLMGYGRHLILIQVCFSGVPKCSWSLIQPFE